MTQAQIDRLRASTRRGAAVAPARSPRVAPQTILAALALLKQALARRQSVAPSIKASQSIIPIDKVSVTKFVKQAVIDSTIDAGIGVAADWAKGVVGSALAGGAAAAEGALTGVASSLAAAAPVAAFGTVAAGLVIGAIDAFGGDFAIPTYATTPQLDATTALGIAAGTKQAKLINADLQTTGIKFARKGVRDPADYLLG